MDKTALQGVTVDDSDPAQLREAIEAACDYRGDVTVTLRGGERVTGYLFDRRAPGGGGRGGIIRVIPAETGEKRVIAIDDVARLEFSGRDTAAGRSWESWVRKYVKTKLAGEAASIEAEKLE
jgi:hypothetical protein